MTLVRPDGRCALPAAPHWARTAVRAFRSAPCQAHWPHPRAGATMGRWPTVLGVSRPIASPQAGPMRSPGGGGGGANLSGQVPCQRPPCAALVFALSVPAFSASVALAPPPAFPLSRFPLSVPCPPPAFFVCRLVHLYSFFSTPSHRPFLALPPCRPSPGLARAVGWSHGGVWCVSMVYCGGGERWARFRPPPFCALGRRMVLCRPGGVGGMRGVGGTGAGHFA